MTDADYRAHLEGRFKVVSSRELSEDQAGALLDDLRAAAGQPKPAFSAKRASGKFAPVLQALWIAAYNLGIVEKPDDAAMLAFVKRQCKVDHDRFMVDGEAARPAIEGLKAWIAREAGVEWVSGADAGRRNKLRVLAAIDRRIRWAGLAGFDMGSFATLEGFGKLEDCTDRQLDKLAAKMGAVLRRQQEIGGANG
ncbi:hypothetical protein CCR94_16435 [Rhodoblastus sphagnicola]|uniref:GemA protein n=2 Tax=Rhodoblastus sphagnicola TaxID=333368 RepID=A0A2S6N332_9HYPH|nr:hypothetical protein CCR94_16435 [Rhodoblastus sphagnicola]